MSAFEWVELAFNVIMGTLSLGISILWILVLWRVYEHFTQRWASDGIRMGPRAAVRRIYCKHRHVARVRSPLGRWYTACVRCAKDVNAGKSREFWR